MAPSDSAYISISASSDARADLAAAALPAWGLSPAARARVGALLAVDVAPESLASFPSPPRLWWSFQEEGRSFVARGAVEADGSLFVHVRMGPGGAEDLGALLGADAAFRSAPPAQGEGESLFGEPAPVFLQAVESHPQRAAELLASLYAVSLLDSAVVIALEGAAPDEVRDVVRLTAFARAALPAPLRARCTAALPLGSPSKLVGELGARVVAFHERDPRLGEAYDLARERGGGVLFSLGRGVSAGPEQELAACRRYAEAAVEVARRGSQAVLRFSHKAGLLDDPTLSEPDALPLPTLLSLTLSAEEPSAADELIGSWAASPEPDRLQALLEPKDWAGASDAVVVRVAATSGQPLAGSRLQAAALRELARRPGAAAGLSERLRAASPADPAAVAHAARLAQAGLLPPDLPDGWTEPVAGALSDEALAEALRHSLAKGPGAKVFTLALLGSARRRTGLNPALSAILQESAAAGRLRDLDLALAAEQAHESAARASLGAVHGLLEAAGSELDAAQKVQVARAALSSQFPAVGPSLLFDETGRLRRGRQWPEEIARAYADLPAGERAELNSEEWASLWATALERPAAADALIGPLDGQMGRSPEKLTQALVREQAWFGWRERSEAPKHVRAAAALAWLAARGPRKPYLEEWKAAVEDLPELGAADLEKLAAKSASRGLFDAIPYFESEQTEDLIRKAPDQRTLDLWTALLSRLPAIDPYRPSDKKAEDYVVDRGADAAARRAAARESQAAASTQRKQALRALGRGDAAEAEALWPKLHELNPTERLAAEALGALLENRLDAACWKQLAELPSTHPLTPLLELIRKRLELEDLGGLSAPLLELLRQRSDWLELSAGKLPALELLAVLTSRSVILLQAMQVARIGAERGYAERSDWWAAFVNQARECPRFDGRPHPTENWAHVHASLYFHAKGFAGEAGVRFRRALEEREPGRTRQETLPEPTLR
ncbi:MAG: hypothetical protein GC160_08620 [Acidobacteria bacterium]|nr:hypothetical protein [Acidobacteriota bacterium]